MNDNFSFKNFGFLIVPFYNYDLGLLHNFVIY